MVNNPWPGLIVGVILVIIGVIMMRSHIRTWRFQESDPTLEDADRLYYGRRYRRRMRISAILAILGVLIGLGDVLLPLQKRHPGPSSLYWIGVLLLTGWVMLLGFADFWSTAAYTRAELARVRQKQRELERRVVEFKHRNLGAQGSSETVD
jgi:hypothetical protein